MTSSPSRVLEEIRRLERLREESPGSLAFVRLAEAYRSSGEHDLALGVLEEGSGRAPDHPAIHLVAARVHHDRGRREEERAALERALEADPQNEVARKALERLAAAAGGGEPRGTGEPGRAGDAGKAEGSAEPASGGGKASHSPEERAELLEQLGGMSREEWWEDEASRDAGSDEDGPVTETMARLYARQGLWEEAESVYRRLRQGRPDDDRLARCLEAVRNEEMPPEPAGRRSPAPRRPDDGGGGEDQGAGTETGDPVTRSEGGDSPTMRGHLRALLRGGGARPVRRSARSEPARPATDRLASRPDDRPARGEEREGDGRDEEMEELLRRWQRAARGGTDG